MQFKLYNLKPLYRSMQSKNKSLEQFDITFNGVAFDCIIDIGTTPFELMIGANGFSFACILYIHRGYITEMSNSDYVNLCKVLQLNWNKNHFSSSVFLNYLDKHIPAVCTPIPVPTEKITPFRASRLTDKERTEGYIFAGWLTHKGKNNGHVRNINKTRLLLGSTVAAYCERNDISSKWTTNENMRQKLIFPWEIPGDD